MRSLLRLSSCLFLFLSIQAYSVETDFHYTEQKVTIENPGNFGVSVSIYEDTAIVGDNFAYNYTGAVYVFKLIDGNWQITQTLFPNDGSQGQFGTSISIDDQKIVIGAPYADTNGPDAGAAYIFELQDNLWIQKHKIIDAFGQPGNRFGFENVDFENLWVAD